MFLDGGQKKSKMKSVNKRRFWKGLDDLLNLLVRADWFDWWISQQRSEVKMLVRLFLNKHIPPDVLREFSGCLCCQSGFYCSSLQCWDGCCSAAKSGYDGANWFHELARRANEMSLWADDQEGVSSDLPSPHLSWVSHLGSLSAWPRTGFLACRWCWCSPEPGWASAHTGIWCIRGKLQTLLSYVFC